MDRAELSHSQVRELVERLLAGDRLALSRVLTQVENDTPAGKQAFNLLFPHTGHAHLVGVTGSPGTGKSSLVNQLARHFRRASPPRRVAIIAVDPSSPFTGGAVLGDRVRMRDLVGDAGIFIRSMAARGTLGGLALSTAAVAQVFDAAGYDVVLIETVGAGQSEVDIARLAHTTVVVEAPGLGDDIQAIKAGILEIADILVVNKADRPGVENTQRALRMMLELAHPSPRLYIDPHCPEPCPENEALLAAARELDEASNGQIWTPPVLLTIANLATGVERLYHAILEHREYLESSGEWERRERARITSEVGNLLQVTLLERWRGTVTLEEYNQVITNLVQRSVSPHQAVSQLLKNTEKAWARTHVESE